jgi:hypothetical protein
MLQVDTPDGLFGGGSSGPAGVMGEEWGKPMCSCFDLSSSEKMK